MIPDINNIHVKCSKIRDSEFFQYLLFFQRRNNPDRLFYMHPLQKDSQNQMELI